ncbi:MAG: protein-glutamate O-methyltransferase [Rhodospirillales bacterium]|tara:strand:+ start:1021 stop:1836 length:816 start_codon:yes stop_codon:yes gene_type:complete
MKPDDFQFMSTMLKQRSGLVLNEDKAYLLESRLMPVARAHNIKGVEELITEIRKSNNEAMIVEVTEAMTTNESFFFRDIKPFDLFREHVLPHVLEKCAAKKSLRIWCAAASNGQEPYSLAMILKEEGAKLAGWKIEIVGTDISRQVLKKAENGLYSQFEVQRGLPITMLVKYFDKADDQWQLKPEIRGMVQYKYYNLLENLAPLGHFDVVFCRNVLIYFDQPTKSKVLEGVAGLMPDYGMLFLGGAETVLGISDKFAPVPGQRGIYALTGK